MGKRVWLSALVTFFLMFAFGSITSANPVTSDEEPVTDQSAYVPKPIPPGEGEVLISVVDLDGRPVPSVGMQILRPNGVSAFAKYLGGTAYAETPMHRMTGSAGQFGGRFPVGTYTIEADPIGGETTLAGFELSDRQVTYVTVKLNGRLGQDLKYVDEIAEFHRLGL